MTTPGIRHSSRPIRAFGFQGRVAPHDNHEQSSVERPNVARRMLGRLSFGKLRGNSGSFLSRRGGGNGEGEPISLPTSSAPPPVPTVMQHSREVYSTALPVLPMIVLSIAMLGEFLTANVSTPFLLFMVKGFGGMSDDAEVAFWTGILVSTFFLTQFLTSLLWATVAEKHGRRAVLVISLSGSAVTCLIFGTSTSLQQAISIRLLQGVFAGAVGVARGSVAFVTDATNEGRAYAILGFCWGFGGVAGAIIGGTFERPAIKWPGVFSDFQLFVTYPYLLPCALAALVTLIGAFLGLFLDRDGGSREGAIRLPLEKVDTHPPIPEEDSAPPSPAAEQSETQSLIQQLQSNVSRRFSNYFASRVPRVHQSPPPARSSVPMSSPPIRSSRPRLTSATNPLNGSAYGYSNHRGRLVSNATSIATRKSRLRNSLWRRRSNQYESESNGDGPELNFTQRLLMANENAVTNIADLWVAAAMNVDNEDPFETDDEELGSDIEASSSDLGEPLVDMDHNLLGRESISSPGQDRRLSHSRPGRDSGPVPHALHRASHAGSRSSQYRPFANRQSSIPTSQEFADLPSSHRRPSVVPSIFSHTGVKVPPAVAASTLNDASERLTPAAQGVSHAEHSTDLEAIVEKSPSLTSQLPVLVIVQYGMLALHSTTHDQIFMSYLVTDYQSGGLNLNAGHFAQLIALMCLGQIAYQFYLYPNLGPPRGRFSHLSMYRIGSFLFIPAYISVILYRVFSSASDDGNFVIMAALTLSTAIRYCGTTFAYTAISILLNYMTPPNVVGYANGIAQSIVSLARCLGPSLGGYVWALSIRDDPRGYYLGFMACAAFCALSTLQSFFIR